MALKIWTRIVLNSFSTTWDKIAPWKASLCSKEDSKPLWLLWEAESVAANQEACQTRSAHWNHPRKKIFKRTKCMLLNRPDRDQALKKAPRRAYHQASSQPRPEEWQRCWTTRGRHRSWPASLQWETARDQRTLFTTKWSSMLLRTYSNENKFKA